MKLRILRLVHGGEDLHAGVTRSLLDEGAIEKRKRPRSSWRGCMAVSESLVASMSKLGDRYETHAALT